jgi:hypothetical protein
VDELERYDEERNMTRVAFKKSVISSGEQSWMLPRSGKILMKPKVFSESQDKNNIFLLRSFNLFSISKILVQKSLELESTLR